MMNSPADEIVEREYRRREQVKLELKGIASTRVSKRNAPIPEGWITGAEAAQIIGTVNRYHLTYIGLPNRSRGGEGKKAQGVGALYERKLVQRVADIMREAGIGARPAARVALAEKAGRL